MRQGYTWASLVGSRIFIPAVCRWCPYWRFSTLCVYTRGAVRDGEQGGFSDT
jgi:hypothetical protein